MKFQRVGWVAVSSSIALFHAAAFAAPPVQIEKDWLKLKLSELSGALPVKLGNETVTIRERESDRGRAQARQYLAQEYQALGFDVSMQGKRDSGPINVVAEKVGADPSKVLILGSHYDTVGNAGADDDGSGTISVMAIARELSKANLAQTVRVVAFDLEEEGLVGSSAYVGSLLESGEIAKLSGAIILEMTGYDSDGDGAFHVIDCVFNPSKPENTSGNLSEMIMRAVQRGHYALKRVTACTDRSDHYSFWQEGKPAIVISQNFFGQDGNPCYHRSCDTVANINFDYMTKITSAVGTAVVDAVVK